MQQQQQQQQQALHVTASHHQTPPPSSFSTSLSTAPSLAPAPAGGGGPSSSSSSSSSPADLRHSLLCLARVAERCERWDDVCRFMAEIVKLTPLMPGDAGSDLSDEERALLSLGYKQLIGQQRNAWKTIKQIQQQSMQQQQQQQQQAAAASGSSSSSSSAAAVSSSSLSVLSDVRYLDLQEDYKQQIEKEIHLSCSELISLLESCLIQHVHRPEPKVAYMKMCGDFYRYLAELVLARTGWSSSAAASAASAAPVAPSSSAAASASAALPGGYELKAHENYSMAYKLAAAALPSNHPTRLACALNLSVCLYEIMRERKAACDVAKAAFDSAIAKLEELEESKYKDATLIMQLLRDNLSLWSQQQQA